MQGPKQTQTMKDKSDLYQSIYKLLGIFSIHTSSGGSASMDNPDNLEVYTRDQSKEERAALKEELNKLNIKFEESTNINSISINIPAQQYTQAIKKLNERIEQIQKLDAELEKNIAKAQNGTVNDVIRIIKEHKGYIRSSKGLMLDKDKVIEIIKQFQLPDGKPKNKITSNYKLEDTVLKMIAREKVHHVHKENEDTLLNKAQQQKSPQPIGKTTQEAPQAAQQPVKSSLGHRAAAMNTQAQKAMKPESKSVSAGPVLSNQEILASLKTSLAKIDEKSLEGFIEKNAYSRLKDKLNQHQGKNDRELLIEIKQLAIPMLISGAKFKSKELTDLITQIKEREVQDAPSVKASKK